MVNKPNAFTGQQLSHKLRRSAKGARENVGPTRRGSRFMLGGIQKLFLTNVMFARVFDSAKRFLSRSPSYQEESEDVKHEIPRSAQLGIVENKMVTTRRGTGTDVESTPASSVRQTRGKRHLEIEVQETPTASKKRRKGASKEEPATEATTEDVQGTAEAEDNADPDFVTKAMPHRTRSKKTYDSAEARTPITRRRSPKIVIPDSSSKETGDESHESETTSSQADVFFTPAQQAFSLPADGDEREESLTPRPAVKAAKATPTSGKGSGKRGRPRKNPVSATPEKSTSGHNSADEVPSSTWDSEQAPLTPTENVEDKSAIAAAGNDNTEKPAAEGEDERQQPERDSAEVRSTAEGPQAKEQVEDLASLGIAYEDVTPDTKVDRPRRHKRFGSEELADDAELTTQAVSTQEPEPVDDDNASDSDEAPEMVTASVAASKAKAAAEGTVRAHQAQQTKEEVRRKERAERIAQEQAEKREREEKKARKLAQKEAKLARRQQREVSSPPRAPTDLHMDSIPDLLPESLLEAAGDHRPFSPPPVRGGKTEEELRREKLNRHIKFLERGEKSIKDVKKGKVNVSVLSQRNMLLAPKANRDTKNIREHWLKGREADRKARGKKGPSFKKMERRAAPKGFLRGGDDD